MKKKQLKKKRQGRKDLIGKAKSFFLIVLSVFIFDRLTKYFVVNFIGTTKVLIPGVLSFTYVVNTGAGFGILKGKVLLLSLITILVILLIIINMKNILPEKYFWAAALILGGAFANLYDRIFYGFIIDFIDFGFWPVFNVADSAVTIGAVGLIFYILKDLKKKN